MSYYDYNGAIHLHSIHSFDGRTSVKDIIRAAKKCEIDFLMLTDHSNLDAKAEEGWHEEILLVVGQEISPRFNHYIAFECTKVIYAEEESKESPQRYIDEVNRQGGFGFIAHPDHKGTRVFHVKHYPWLDWSVHGFTGMGIWDFMTDWQEKLTGYTHGLVSYLCPALVLTGPKKETLRRWDALSMERPVVGIGELDNHDTLYKLLGIHIRAFPFERVFRLIRTHVLTEQPFTMQNADISLLLDALRRGHAYVAMEYFSDAKGFSFAVTGREIQGIMGDEFSLSGTATLKVQLPEEGRAKILRNGKPLGEYAGKGCEVEVRKPGVYRCEVYQKRWGRWRPWIFSNPIYLR